LILMCVVRRIDNRCSDAGIYRIFDHGVDEVRRRPVMNTEKK